MIVIREVDKNDSARWDTFVYSQQESDYSHLFVWKSIYEESYALETLYLGAFDNDNLVAILSTVLLKYPFKKNVAYSLPYLNYSGLLNTVNYDKNFLLEKFFDYLKQKEVRGIELRKLNLNSNLIEDICTFKLSLPKNEEELWNSFKPKVRNQIRKAQKYGFEVKWGAQHLDSFYKIYSKNMHDLGTPVHSKVFFEKIIEKFPTETNLITIYKGTTAVASMFLMKYKKSLSDPWASSLREFLEYCPNMLMYWEALKFGCINNFNEFDFGRSRINTGTFRFKTQWGAKPIPLEYSFYVFGETKGEISSSSYRGKKADIFIRIWKLIPYKIALWLGPKVRKFIP
jgi:serine/alanine adding enzyme